MTGDLLKAALEFAQSIQGRPFKDRCLMFKAVPGGDRVEEYASGTKIGDFRDLLKHQRQNLFCL